MLQSRYSRCMTHTICRRTRYQRVGQFHRRSLDIQTRHWPRTDIWIHLSKSISTLTTAILYPPGIFAALLLTLWTYKCLAMIVFQNKIIYMPSMPPFARSEELKDYEVACRPVVWREERTKAMDGVDIAMAVGQIRQSEDEQIEKRKVVILYFQGNGGSTPPRLPALSRVLKDLAKAQSRVIDYVIVALSYRGFWKSSGRASERGIKLDASAAMAWARQTYPQMETLILWGQSLGAGVAVSTAALDMRSTPSVAGQRVTAIILETPFVAVRDMLNALYPQKWLPYRYLSPFLWNFWDSRRGLHEIGQTLSRPKVLICKAGKDEIVPQTHAGILEQICKDAGLCCQRVDVNGALHHEAAMKPQGRHAVVNFIKSMTDPVG